MDAERNLADNNPTKAAATIVLGPRRRRDLVYLSLLHQAASKSQALQTNTISSQQNTSSGPILPHIRVVMLTLLPTNYQESVVQNSMLPATEFAHKTEQSNQALPSLRLNQTEYLYLSKQELEEVADELLRESVAALGRGEYPFYSEAWLRQLQQREADAPTAGEADHTIEEKPLPQLCLRLLAQTPMKHQWRAAIRLSIKGMTVREIARRLDTSPAGVSRWLKAGLARLAAAAVNLDELYNQREAIRAVWQEETRRYAPRKERHCRPGQEACRTSGLCPYRWYLLFEQ